MKHRSLFPVLAVAAAAFASLATLSSAAFAGGKPWTSDDILALKTVSDPQVSPDGRWVAYVVSELNGDRSDYQTDVWLVPSAGGESRRLTASSNADEFPRWSPDGKLVAFLSERPRPGAKKDDAPKEPAQDEGKRQIWLIHPDGGEAWMLSDAKGGVSAFEWSRDGRTIAYLSKEPKSDERRRKEKDRDDAITPKEMYAWNRLWVMDVASKKAMQLTSGDLHVSSFSFSPDGRKLAIAAQPTPLIPDNFNSDLYVVPATGGKPAPLVVRTGTDARPLWSPDGRWIAFVSQDGKSAEWFVNSYLCVVSPAGGAARNVTSGFDEQVEGLGAGGLVWTPDSRSIVFQSNQHTAQQLFRAHPDGRPVERITSGDGMSSAFSCGADGEVACCLRQDSEHPTEVFRLARDGGAPVRLTDTNPQVADFLSFPKRLVTWKGAGGMEIEGLVIYPPSYKAGQRVPLLLNVHGGPAGTHSNTCTVASKLYPWPLFAQKGYAILLPNPRGSGGYGEAFRAANRRDWGGKDYEDIMAGVDALIEHGVADPARLAVCGWSYGGFMTSTIVTKTDRFRAAVVGAGVTDLVSMAGTCDIPDFNRSYFDSWPWEDPQFYVDHSALLHAGNVKTPTLLVHGQADERVPTSQGWEFYTALKQRGIATDLLLLPRQPHGPREPRLLKAVQQWHMDWIDRYTLAQAPVARRATKPAPGAKLATGSNP
jgi:dipeptidyl aminopeptidase/acylaminoacyl peptidase